MPATAGRVRMPANNRVHSSAALQTHGIWQSAIGYDPYAPNKDDSKKSTQENSSAAEPEGENAYASFQGLLALARITSSNVDEARGACKRCGRVGHLAFQCRNFVSVKDGDKEKDSEAVQAAVLSGLEKIKGNGKRAIQGEESDEDESETSDSEVDSEIERIIAERKKEDSDDDGSDSGRKKRGRSKKRRSKKRGSSDSEDEDEDKDRRKKRKEKRRKKNESSGEEDDRQRRKRKSRKEKRRRRSHRHSDDSDSDEHEHSGRRHKQKSTKASSLSDPDASGSDDPRVGRDTKRSEKKIRKRHHEDDE
ncbi:SREK1IP1 FAMILY MEMBER [Salix purpurea]|uniref:SREK1IP1 FAMILY MEMBER n=1 Tax=Salix purpurea TaxID=77065 RepID=A0A9Q0TI57_SALPP|nr:SREK1IP1 FAMILY MEMBER [Salix purpurea]